MALKGPTPEDEKKINSEVNQIVNQRFLLTTTAITVFGVVITILMPKTALVANEPISNFIVIGSFILSTILFILFILSHLLKGMMRIFTTYLIESDKSGWEKDWAEFRKGKYVGYSKSQTLVFLFLTLFSLSFPFFITLVYNQKYDFLLLSNLILIIISLIYELLMIGISYFGWFDNEKELQKRWKTLKEKTEQ